MFETIFNIIFPAFTLIAVGVVYAYIRPEVSTKSLNHLALYIGMPAISVKNIMAIELGDLQIPSILAGAVLTSVIPTLLGYLWIRMGKVENRGLLLPIAFINAVILPLPIIQLAWGGPGVAVATVFFTIQANLLLVFGIMIIAKEDKVKEMLKQPYIYVLALAFFLNWQGVKLPKAVDSLLTMCAQMSYPLMLIIIGIILFRSFREFNIQSTKYSLIAALIRVACGVLTALLVVFIFKVEGITRTVLLFYGIMPGAITTSLFAEKYNRDSEVVTQSVFFGTVLTLILIPVALALLI